MITYIKNLFNKYTKIKDKQDHEMYYNHVFERYMYVKICPICHNKVYVFEYPEQFNTHKLECYSFYLLMQRRNYFN